MAADKKRTKHDGYNEKINYGRNNNLSISRGVRAYNIRR